MKRALITGGAGFIGSNLADRLVADGVQVVVYDDFRTGRRKFLQQLSDRVTVVEGDVLDGDRLAEAMQGCDTVFHLQSNADVRRGLEHPRLDIEQSILATSTVLETMRAIGAERIAFSSTASIYGEPDVVPTPEDCPFPVQTSLYGASKLTAEGLIAAYAHGFGFTGVVLRFVSVLGERYTHGHVFDFFASLRRDPRRLRILGDGRQRKSYLYVGDCVDGVLKALEATPAGARRIGPIRSSRKKQRRIGKEGLPFEILKFRSMYEGSQTGRGELRDVNEADGLFKIERDPRMTRVGREIRRLSLDELPQLVNVLKGKMSLVGPRPLVPDEDAQIEGFYRRRLDIAPGITGYWQSLGSSRIPLADMIQLDFLYVANWSLWNDVRILLRTVPYVAGRRGR